MEGTGAINVKAYLELSGQAPAEIRRFDLDQDVSTNFEYLKSKIASIYPSLSHQNFRVYWRDDEGDMIAISSDEELIQGMLYGRTNGLLKLYIHANDATTSEPRHPDGSGFASNVEHPGVVCDCCDTTVRGVRFKCLVCPDYDLCTACCDKGIHNHHYMLRLASPASEWVGCGRRGGAASAGGRHAGAGWGWPAFGGIHGGWNTPGINMRRFWRNLMKSGAAGGGGAEQSSENPPPASAEGDGAEAGMNDAQREQQRDYLQHVGEQVSAMLEPMGVSVDVEVEERNGARHRAGGCKPREQGKGQGKGQGRRLGGKGHQCGGGRFKPAGDCRRGGACANADQCTRGGRCKSAGDCNKGGPCMEDVQPQAGNEAGGERQSATGNQSQSATAATGNQSQSATVATGNQSAESNVDGASKVDRGSELRDDADMDSGEDASWIRIDPKSEDMDIIALDDARVHSSPSSAPVLTPHVIPVMKLYPSLSKAAPTAPTEEPKADPQQLPSADASIPKSELDVKVAEAIEQMRAMGFHDDGGWMTAMLYENNGDVYRVIDSVLRAAQVNSRRE